MRFPGQQVGAAWLDRETGDIYRLVAHSSKYQQVDGVWTEVESPSYAAHRLLGGTSSPVDLPSSASLIYEPKETR